MNRNRTTHGLKKAKHVARNAAVVMLGAAMTLTPALPVFADSAAPVVGVSGEQADVDGLKGTVTVSGIQAKDKDAVTVTAYQIVDGVYKDNKLVKYVLMDPTYGKIAAITEENQKDGAGQTKGLTDGQNDIITEAEITQIANNIDSKNFTADAGVALTKGSDGLTYTGSLEPGMYIVLVRGATDTVYNPAVVSVNLTDANAASGDDVQAGSVDLSKFFQTYDGTSTTDVYVKSSLSDMDKNITGSKKHVAVSEEDQNLDLTANIDPENVANGKSKGDTVAYGDTCYFKVDGMTVPSFTADYNMPQYQISDKLDADAFSGISNLVVKVNGTEVAPSDDTYTLTEDGDKDFTAGSSKGFVVAFTGSFLNAHRGDATRPTVEITYSANLLTSAGLNYAENLNHAELKYSNNPNDSSSFKTIKKNTYHYTFGIDAALDGEDNSTEETHEFNKVTRATSEGEYVDGKGTIAKDKATKKSGYALAGAEFTIYSDEGCTKPVTRDGKNYTATSDANGHFSFVGLDEGTYYVKETKAPAKYTLSSNVYQFNISAELDQATGVMKTYSIVTKSKDTSIKNDTWHDAGTATYTNTFNANSIADDGAVTNTISSTVTPMEVVDTKLMTLPSTGAMGTIWLSIAAAAGMGIFFTIYEKEHKKNESKANN